MNAAAGGFRWYREPVVWLGALVLATALGGCISLIRTASRHVDADLPDPVDRRARMQVSAERRSAALPPQASLRREGDTLVLQADAAAPASLRLLFWSTRAEHDVVVQLQRSPDGRYRAAWPDLPPIKMYLRVDTPTRDDALVGTWTPDARLAELHEPPP
jgi:hypothetical protein